MKKIITALSLAALSVYAVASDAQIEAQLKKTWYITNGN